MALVAAIATLAATTVLYSFKKYRKLVTKTLRALVPRMGHNGEFNMVIFFQ